MDYFYNKIKEMAENKKVDIYVDMDGVVADYDLLNFENVKTSPDAYLNKRPITTVINILRNLSQLDNVTIYILSVAKQENQINGKLVWLSENMNFIPKNQINIIPRDTNGWTKACILKKEFLKSNYEKDNISLMIDDSHDVLKEVKNLDIGIIPIHISTVID